VAFKQGGYIASLRQVRGPDGRFRDIQLGDMAPAGVVLAAVQKKDYRESLNQAAANQKSMEGSLQASQADLERAKANETKAELDYKRAQSLYAGKAMTRPDYDDAVNQYQSAVAEVQSASKQIDSRQGQLNSAKSEVSTAEITLNETDLIAPLTGVIVAKSVEPGTLVAKGSNAFAIADTRIVKMQFGVPDTMLSHFKIGASVPVDIDGLSNSYRNGRVTQIAESADADARVFNIQVSLANAQRELKVGMIASVQIVQDTDVQQLPLVPVTALSTAQSGSSQFSVYVVREKNGRQTAHLQSVRIGETYGRSIAIREGLTPGEKIISNRPNQLADGAVIRAIE
jgi:RND family efflux transporter MFP subunit